MIAFTSVLWALCSESCTGAHFPGQSLQAGDCVSQDTPSPAVEKEGSALGSDPGPTSYSL